MGHKADTRLEYEKKTNIVLDYIDHNLDRKLTVKELAGIAHLSEFHFHRILKGMLGESIGNLITRKRVEAAAHLIRYTTLEIKEIASNVGYESAASLTKLFRQYYHISPTGFRKNRNFFIVRPEIQDPHIAPGTPVMRTITDKHVMYIRITGRYGNKNYRKVWQELWNFAATNNLITDKTERIGISYDDPKITQQDKCNYDACLTIEKAITPRGRIGCKTIKGGDFAVFTYQGGYDNLGAFYDAIFGKWVLHNDYELRNVPVMEKKCNPVKETIPEKLVTEIYVPIK